jgi:hypothetical protein
MLSLAATIAAAAATLTSPGPVHALALDTPLLAYASGRSAGDCDRIRIWSRATRRTVRLGRTTSCEQTSTGTGIAALSIAGNRVLWLHYTGGNIREWSLFTATTARPRPRRLRFVSRDVDEPSPIVLGEGDTTRYGELLPYAVDRDVVVLRPNGARAFTWRAPARVTALGANWGGLAVALADGRVAIFENDGSMETTWAGSPAATAVFVTGNAVAAQRGRIVEMRSGSVMRRWTLPVDARLRDAEGYEAVYVSRGRLKLLRLDTGRTRDLGRASDAQLEYSTVAAATGRRIRVFRLRAG